MIELEYGVHEFEPNQDAETRQGLRPTSFSSSNWHGFWCALSNAVTSLATMIMQRVIFHHFPMFLLLNSARCFEVPAETHLLVHGKNKHVQFRDLLSHLQLFALWFTANRCDVATHVASLVFGCELSTRCESFGRHSLHRLKCPRDASQLDGILCC